jgi:hypothetical protein
VVLLRPANERPPVAADLGSCERRLADLQAEIAVLERKIQRHRSPFEVFDQSEPNPGLTAELGALLSRSLAPDGGAHAEAALQCRGRVCCAKSAGDAGIKGSLEPFYEELRAQRRLRGGTSWRGVSEVCFGVRLEGDPPEGIDLVREAVKALRASGAVERCQDRFHDEGTLETRINLVGHEDDLEDEPLGLSVRVGGKLAGTPLGECLASELRAALNRVALPPAFESGVVFARFPKR